MIKDTHFVYGVARIRSNENSLVPSTVLENMINAENYDDALKALRDSVYKNVDSDNLEKVLEERLSEAAKLVYEASPDRHCLDFLIVNNDFHNIKALIKGIVSSSDVSNVLLSPSVIDVDLLKKAIESKSFCDIPEPFSGIVKEAYSLVTTTMDGQLLEIFLDKKCMESVLSLSQIFEDEFAKNLAITLVSLTNFKIALRCIKTGKNASFMKDALCDCGKISVKELVSACECGVSELSLYMQRCGFDKLSAVVGSGYAAFEKAGDDLVMDIVKHAKYTSFGSSPLVAYYFAVNAEIKNIRIILSCKKNGIDKESIRERVRALYV